MSYCLKDHPEYEDLEEESQFLVCEENWERLKMEWDKAKEVLTTDREIERFQSICRWVLLRRVDQRVGLDMAVKIKPELARIYPEFIYWLCSCYYVDLSRYEEGGSAKVQVRIAATNAILALKALQHNLEAPDNSAVANVPKYIERGGNILLKNILEGALSMHCNATTAGSNAPTTLTLTARDFLDSFVLCENPNPIFHKDEAFLTFKKQLVKIAERDGSYSSTSSIPPCIQEELDNIKKESIQEADDYVYQQLVAKTNQKFLL